MKVASSSDSDLSLGREPASGLSRFYRELRSLDSVGALFARCAETACSDLKFDRAVVVSVAQGQLGAGETDAMSNRASDALRRQILAEPIRIDPASEEATLIKRSEGAADNGDSTGSVLQRALDLTEYALGAVAPEGRVLAILVVDRNGPRVANADRRRVESLAEILGIALERIVLHARVSELSAEFRHLAASAQALMAEMLEAPVSLPSEHRHGPSFPWMGIIEPLPEAQISELLSNREREIAQLLVQGRSNPEIAAELILSPFTVKDHVARILKKLGVANRVEAVSRLLSLTQNNTGRASGPH
jgi:DNA-binding CsgD family transcriptional regulator